MTFPGGLDQNFVQGLVSADRDVLLDVVRIDDSAIAQDDFLLAFEEWHLVPRRNFRIAMAVDDRGR